MDRQIPDFEESQAEFWRHIQPDIKIALEYLEKAESWTYYMEELPTLFNSTSQALPAVANIPLEKPDHQVVHDLISILAVMPFRQCVYALAWMDANSESDIGWGMVCYMEAESISSEMDYYDESLYLCSRIIDERIKALVILDVAAKLFSGSSLGRIEI